MNKIVNVLVLEDSESDFAFLLLYLDKIAKIGDLQIETTRTTTVAQAIEVLETKPFDIIFSDMGLPDSSGMHTVFRLVSHSKLTPVVIISGLSLQQDDQQALTDLNILDFLDKNSVFTSNQGF